MQLFWQHFSKKTLLLIVLLLVVTGGLLYLAVKEDQPTLSTVISATPTPSPAHTVLSLVPETSVASALQVVDVVARSNGNTLSGAQLDLSYDPTVLHTVTIQPGSFFTNPVVLFHSVDKVNGRISYVLAIQPTGMEASGSGIVATISYSFTPTASTSTTLAFLPKTEVTQEGIMGSVLKSAQNITIAVPQAFLISPTPTL